MFAPQQYHKLFRPQKKKHMFTWYVILTANLLNMIKPIYVNYKRLKYSTSARQCLLTTAPQPSECVIGYAVLNVILQLIRRRVKGGGRSSRVTITGKRRYVYQPFFSCVANAPVGESRLTHLP